MEVLKAAQMACSSDYSRVVQSAEQMELPPAAVMEQRMVVMTAAKKALRWADHLAG